MGHCINGFIASYETLQVAAQSLPHAKVARLRQGLGFLPLTDEVASLNEPASQHDALDRLTVPMEQWAIQHSAQCPIAYIETDYFGGDGCQSSIVWAEGKTALEPIRATNAINTALHLLGIKASLFHDEFDAIGLGQFRDNESWLESTR